MRMTISLADRTLTSPPVIADLVSNLQSRVFNPNHDLLIVVGVCAAGLREVEQTPLGEAHLAIANLPKRTRFLIVPKEEISQWQ